ncbi:MAG: MC/SLC25 family protein [archaeon]|nr:MC/SLC25 family protein [archaeon]
MTSENSTEGRAAAQAPHALKWSHLLAGGAGGAVGAIVMMPLEVVKTRLQSRAVSGVAVAESVPQNVVQWTWHAMRGIVQREGVRGLWRGLAPTLVGVVPSRALYFSVYSATKAHLLPLGRADSGAQQSAIHFAAAMNAGVVSTTVTSPLWMVKTRLQLATERTTAANRSASGSVGLAYQLVRREGFLSLWRGLSASYLGVFETCLQWVIYEQMKHSAAAYLYGDRDAHARLHPAALFSFASASKLVASVSWYPHEVARTRLREHGHPYTGLWNCFATIARTEGLRKLYAGLAVHLVRAVPNSAITFMVFEVVSKSLAEGPNPALQDKDE